MTADPDIIHSHVSNDEISTQQSKTCPRGSRNWDAHFVVGRQEVGRSPSLKNSRALRKEGPNEDAGCGCCWLRLRPFGAGRLVARQAVVGDVEVADDGNDEGVLNSDAIGKPAQEQGDGGTTDLADGGDPGAFTFHGAQPGDGERKKIGINDGVGEAAK